MFWIGEEIDSIRMENGRSEDTYRFASLDEAHRGIRERVINGWQWIPTDHPLTFMFLKLPQ